MITRPPRIVLQCDIIDGPENASECFAQSQWHFHLRSDDGDLQLEAADVEPGASTERLELLAVVRGLEAIPTAATVTLETSSSAIRRGLRFGLDYWRENRWRWERFGRMTPIKHADLWQRIDRAMEIHDIDCQVTGSPAPADDLNRRSEFTLSVTDNTQPATSKQSSMPLTPATRANERPEVPSNESTGTSVWTQRLFGWCGLCRSDSSLVIAAS